MLTRLKTGMIQKLRFYFCPLLLGMTVCYAVIHALYNEMALLYTVLFAVSGLLLFRFFDMLHARKTVGGLIYTAILVVLGMTSIGIIFFEMIQTRNPIIFRMWLYGAEGFDHRQLNLLNAVFISGGFFLISILYYFTQVRYRTLGLMLCILFPFVISSKRAETLDENIIFMIALSYLVTVIHNQRVATSDSRTVLAVDRSYFVSIGVFIAVTLAVAMTIERPNYLAQLQRNPDYFEYNPNRSAINKTKSLENPSFQSSERYGARNFSDTPLFYFQTDGKQNVYYLRRQAYSVFDGEIWKMTDMDNYSAWQFYGTDGAEYSTEEILNDWQKIKAVDNHTTDEFLQRKNGKVYSQTFAPSYLPSPFGIVCDDVTAGYIKYPQGTVLRTSDNDNRKSVLNDSFVFEEQTSALYAYLKQSDLDSETYLNILLENDSVEAGRLRDDYYRAQYSYSDTANISNDVSQLAVQITEHYHSDIDKATALEKYFSENDYLYDEDANPQDTSIDYFIFRGKAGVCSSYATAMTLMARSIGLPARYVEGFAGFEKSDVDTFVIRDKHSHAFVEVYISGAGWITFDPTVSDYRQLSEEDNSYWGIIWQMLDRCKYLLIVGVFIVLLLRSDRLSELGFRIRQLFRTPQQKTVQLYAHVVKLIDFSAEGNYYSYTVNMLREYMISSRGVVPESLLQLFEQTAFGGYQPTEQEYREAYAEYRKCYRYLRKIPAKKHLPERLE